MADYRSPNLQAPHRKPVPGHAGFQFHSSESPNPPPQRRPHEQLSVGIQNHPRTAPSSFPPNTMQAPRQAPSGYPQHHYGAPPSRQPSNATSGTNSTGGNAAVPQRHSSHAEISRSSSSHMSSNPQVGYVALMRKQRATVWCDRGQSEDPRVVAQRRAAKQRALLEVHRGSRNSMVAGGGKIRHNTTGRSMSYNTSTMIGAGVPLRLSANEVGNADDDIDDREVPSLHRRTGSGRSSTASNRVPSTHQKTQQQQQGRFSSGSSAHTPSSVEHSLEGRTPIPDIIETPAPIRDADADYVQSTASEAVREPATTNTTMDAPVGTAISHTNINESEEDFGKATEMYAPSGAATAMQKRKVSDDLKRRGSVDDRTTTMSGVRLFVANPDLSD